MGWKRNRINGKGCLKKGAMEDGNNVFYRKTQRIFHINDNKSKYMGQVPYGIVLYIGHIPGLPQAY